MCKISITKISQKFRTQWTTFCFKHKIQLACSRQMTQIKKKEKKKKKKINGSPVLEKRFFSKTFFTPVLTIAKGKILTRCVCQFIFLKIFSSKYCPCKAPLYVYWKCQVIYSTSYLKLHNTHE